MTQSTKEAKHALTHTTHLMKYILFLAGILNIYKNEIWDKMKRESNGDINIIASDFHRINSSHSNGHPFYFHF